MTYNCSFSCSLLTNIFNNLLKLRELVLRKPPSLLNTLL